MQFFLRHSVVTETALRCYISIGQHSCVGVAVLAIWRAVVSDLVGGGRVDVHRFHLQPGGDQHWPLHRDQSTCALRQSHVAVPSQASHHRRLDSIVRHLFPAAHWLERWKSRGIPCRCCGDRLHWCGTRHSISTRSRRLADVTVGLSLGLGHKTKK